MKGITAVTLISRKYLASEVDTNDATLSTIITQLGFIITSTRPGEPVLHRVELKYFRARSSNKSHSYMVGFLFDPQADGKLVRINHQHIHEVMSFISSGSQLNRESTIMLVGKKGSRKDNRFTFKCNQNESDNVLIREFTSHDNIQSYISTLLSDFDRIESRRTRDPVRADMAVIQISDKSLRISPELDRVKVQELVFANQLLQIPGVTEKLALALSHRFHNMAGLMAYFTNEHSLRDFTFCDSRQATKKINSRLLTVLGRIFDRSAEPDLCIW